jgi:TolB protein
VLNNEAPDHQGDDRHTQQCGQHGLAGAPRPRRSETALTAPLIHRSGGLWTADARRGTRRGAQPDDGHWPLALAEATTPVISHASDNTAVDGARGRMRSTAVALAVAVLTGIAASVALGTSLPVRTFDVSLLSGDSTAAATPAADPALSDDGTIIAYDLAGSAPYGIAVDEQVYTVDVFTGMRTLVSATAENQPADGKSGDPSVSAAGTTVAFTSTASDLPVPGSSVSNVYVRLPDGHLELVSATPGGGVANGASTQPVVSSDGDFVAFTSTATNLVAGPPTHGSDVYVRDLATGRTVLVSATPMGAPGNRWASNPSISATGRYLSFDSGATDLVRRKKLTSPQVYLRDMSRQRTQLISVTSGGVPQNKSVAAPFRQVSSISADGSYVAFDSNANNLVRGDTNRSTDVFVRDVRRHRTTLISENNDGYEGNSDSFAPAISANGTEVAFESFASNLAPGGGRRENVFVRDLPPGLTSVIDVGPEGQQPGRERVSGLLQQPALSGDGLVAAFESTALNLTHEALPQTHVFLRLLDPPQASFTTAPPTNVGGDRVSLAVRADDPHASDFSCQLNAEAPFPCRPGTIVFSHLHPGRQQLSIRAGGPGLLFQPLALLASVVVR